MNFSFPSPSMGEGEGELGSGELHSGGFNEYRRMC
jgi:hypothetical protein